MPLLRLTLLLLLLNVGYAAWTQGWLADYGWSQNAQTEPQRLQQQIRPEALRILPVNAVPPLSQAPALPSAADTLEVNASDTLARVPLSASSSLAVAAPAASAPTAIQCLQAGLFSVAEASLLRLRLPGLLPRGSWVWQAGIEPPRWIVYMGKYPDEEALAKKRAELRQLNVFFEPLINPALSPGLSLGHFSLRADAEAALARASTRGVRTAKVLLEQAAVQGQWLRLPAVDEALKPRLDALKPRLFGKTLKLCP